MAKRRILHTVRQFAPSVGGLESYVAHLARRQSQHSDVEVLTLNRLFRGDEQLPANEIIDGVRVRRVPYVGRSRMFFPIFDPSILADYTLIHIHAADQLLDLVAFHARRMDIPYFIVSHGLFFHTPRYLAMKKIYLRGITRRALTRAEAVFAVSRHDQKRINSIGVNAVLLRNPIDPFPFVENEGDDLIYIGRLSENKRIDKLLDFVAALGSNHAHVKLHIVGADLDGARARLEAYASRLGLGDRVRFHGYLPRDALIKLLPECRYVVSASRYEGYGLSIVEAMSAGLTPFLQRNDAFEETLGQSGVGVLTSFDDPARAAADFAALAAQSNATDREIARSYGLRQSWDDVEARIEEAYADALARRAADEPA